MTTDASRSAHDQTPNDQTPNEESRDAWNANAAFWDERMGDGNDWHLELVWPATERLLEPVEGKRILDVGCGNGLVSRRLAARGTDVLGIDVAEGMLERARSHRTDYDGNIEYRLLDCTDETALLALGDAQFDAAIACMMLMDMAEIRPLFRGLARILKPGAPIVFSVLHPAFNNSGGRLISERDIDTGALTYSVQVARYLHEEQTHGVAIAGQPQQQPYFFRPLHALLGAGFAAGFVVDGLEEPAFDGARAQPGGVTWGNYPHIPPVLVVRMRCRE